MFGPQNKYYRVVKPLPAWGLVAHMAGNEWIGASRCLWPIYKTLTLQPGDEIHELAGGTFAVTRSGRVYECLKVMQPPIVMSVMLRGGGAVKRSVAELAVDLVEEIAKCASTRPESYRPATPVLSDTDGYAKTQQLVQDPSTVGRVLRAEFNDQF